MRPSGGKMCQMESVRLAINDHMTSLGEEILCVLDKQLRGADVCCVKLNVRVFVLERLSASAQWMCSLFQREIETLETLLDHQSKLLDMAFNVDTHIHTAEGNEGRSSGAQQEAGSQEQEVLLGGPEEADVSTSLLLQKKKTCVFQDLPLVKEEAVCSEGAVPPPFHRGALVVPAGGPRLIQETPERKEDAVPPEFHQGVLIPGAEQQALLPAEVKREEEEEEDADPEEDAPLWKQGEQQEKPFSCMFCQKSFNLNGNLKRHMRIHTGERPFSCATCGKRFGEKKDLHRHMRTHTGEKPFSCAVCAKRFSESSSLKTHMSIHTGEKRFVCTVCGKGWCKKDDLTKHMRIHTGEKPFMCTVCSRCFSRGETLKKHIRTHR